MLPQAHADAPTLRGEVQLLFTCQPADAREHQLIRQRRSLFQLAECQLAVLIQISPRYRQMVPAAFSIPACISDLPSSLGYAEHFMTATLPQPSPARTACSSHGTSSSRW